MTLQSSFGAVSERCRIENDTLKSGTQKASGLEPLSESGTKLMRLFLSPSVKVYYLYFKGSEQRRGRERHCSSPEQRQEQKMLRWGAAGRWPLSAAKGVPGGQCPGGHTCDDQ